MVVASSPPARNHTTDVSLDDMKRAILFLVFLLPGVGLFAGNFLEGYLFHVHAVGVLPLFLFVLVAPFVIAWITTKAIFPKVSFGAKGAIVTVLFLGCASLTLIGTPSTMDCRFRGFAAALRARGNLDAVQAWATKTLNDYEQGNLALPNRAGHCPIAASWAIADENLSQAVTSGVFKKDYVWPQYAVAEWPTGSRCVVISWYSFGLLVGRPDFDERYSDLCRRVSPGIYIYPDGRK